MAAGVEGWITALPLATVGERLRAVATRLAYGVSLIAAFALGSVGAFLTFDWPPLLRELVLLYLLAFLVLRVALLFGRFLLAPGEIGRASCRERVCPYVSISVVAVSLKKTQTTKI